MSSNVAATPAEGLENLLAALAPFLAPPPAGGSGPSTVVLSVSERAIGIGNRRGLEQLGPLVVAEMTGGRIEVRIRLHAWGLDEAGANLALQNLQTRLLRADNGLRSAGVLSLAIEDARVAQPANAAGGGAAWLATTDCRLLCEYVHAFGESAESLIVRIPVNMAEYDGQMVALRSFVRWDANEAPALELNTGGQVSGLYLLALLPAGWNGGAVTITATGGPNLRQRTYATARDLMAALTAEPVAPRLGGNIYSAARLTFPNGDFPDPIRLGVNNGSGTAPFAVRYSAGALNHPQAVIYVKAITT